MDQASPTKIPVLPLLGFALLAEAAAPFSPLLKDAPTVWYFKGMLFESVLIVFLAAFVLYGCLRKSTRRPAAPLVVFCVLVLLDNMIQQQLLAYAGYSNMSLTLQSVLSFPALGLMAVGAPLLWGSAMARRENPSDAAAITLGRIGAGIVQFAFCFVAAQEIGGMMMRGGFIFQEVAHAPLASLANLIRIAFRVLILWASIQSVRTTGDDAVIRLRARMIHRLMSWWFGLVALNIGVYFMLGNTLSRTFTRFSLWSGVAYLTITLTTALLTAARLRSVGEGYNSEPVPHP